VTSSTPDALWASRSVRLLRPAAVVVSGLRRSVRRRRLLDGVDLRVPVGARLLLVSDPEGAGSLLLGILAGLIRPHAGSFDLAGLSRDDESSSGWRRRVAYLGPESGYYEWLSPIEVLDLAGRLAGHDGAERERKTDAAIEHYRLGPALRAPVRRGGPGLAQKVGLAAAMLTDPEVLLLDDPLRALEAGERARLLRIPGRRRTVLLASRYPASEDGLVNQVALLRGGRIAIHARREELDEHDLPLSLRGISALADLRATGQPAVAASA
jgi:ABC-2 type transport system ATP-binding protein